MKEAIAKQRGNLEDLVNVIGKDLSQPGRYATIAELYWENGQIEQAIEWAEQGMAVFAHSYRVDRLANFLINAYEQTGRLEEAVAIVWTDFKRSPSLSLYQKLKTQAEKAQNWLQWRDRALAHIRDLMQNPPTNVYNHYSYHNPAALLVEVFLWEDVIEQAWETAQAHGCSPQLWMKLADLRATDHPEASLAIYQPAVEPLINQTNNDAYAQAVDLLLKIQAIMTKLDRLAEFEVLVTTLSQTYKRKRNFVKLLSQNGLIP